MYNRGRAHLRVFLDTSFKFDDHLDHFLKNSNGWPGKRRAPTVPCLSKTSVTLTKCATAKDCTNTSAISERRAAYTTVPRTSFANDWLARVPSMTQMNTTK